MTKPAHQVTTAHLGALYPFVAEPGLGISKVAVGRDLLGGTFSYDPFDLYAAGTLTNPNMVVFGQIGRGKSAFVKTYLWRQAVFGRRVWVLDPKGEYATLARRWGTAPVALSPGGGCRLNPLEDLSGPASPAARAGQHLESVRRRAELLASLAASGLRRHLQPNERTAVELALETVCLPGGPAPILPDVVDALLDPTPAAAASVRCTRDVLVDDGRQVGLELRRLVTGDLRGMFDGHSTAGVDLQGSLVVLDLSAVYHSPALGILMACAAAALQAALAVDQGGAHGTILVVDEAWAVLGDVGIARWLQRSWKLARAWGVANVAVFHRVSDLRAVGAAGSEEVSLVQGLLADSETRVVYGQSPGELPVAAELLGLSDTEVELVGALRRGVALWKVAGRSFLVRHVVGEHERAIVDTDAAMAVPGRGAALQDR